MQRRGSRRDAHVRADEAELLDPALDVDIDRKLDARTVEDEPTLGLHPVLRASWMRRHQQKRIPAAGHQQWQHCLAAYSWISERGMHRYSPWTVLFYAMVFAALSWNLFYAPFKYLWAGYSLEQWGWMMYIAVMGPTLPFGLYLVGVNQILSTRASISSTRSEKWSITGK